MVLGSAGICWGTSSEQGGRGRDGQEGGAGRGTAEASPGAWAHACSGRRPAGRDGGPAELLPCSHNPAAALRGTNRGVGRGGGGGGGGSNSRGQGSAVRCLRGGQQGRRSAGRKFGKGGKTQNLLLGSTTRWGFVGRRGHGTRRGRMEAEHRGVGPRSEAWPTGRLARGRPAPNGRAPWPADGGRSASLARLAAAAPGAAGPRRTIITSHDLHARGSGSRLLESDGRCARAAC